MIRRATMAVIVPAAAAAVLGGGWAARAGTAGTPVPQQTILCGTGTAGTDRFSGSSGVDHPSGASFTGDAFPYTGQTCKNNGASSQGMFTWTIAHSNVRVADEKGTEHGEFVLSSAPEAGFDGHITQFDYPSNPSPSPVTCGDGRVVDYSSGHLYDDCGQGGSVGNFNTHGGAATGQHFRGNYGTVVYQEDPNANPQTKCPTGSATYCFEAILEGQTN